MFHIGRSFRTGPANHRYSTVVSTSNGPMTSSSSARYVSLGFSTCVFANTTPLTRAASPADFTPEDTLYSTPLILMVTSPPSAQSDCTTVIGPSCAGVALAGVASSAPPSSAPSATASAVIQYFLIRASSCCRESCLAHDTTPGGVIDEPR